MVERNNIKHSGLKKYLKNTSWVFIGKILRMVAGLFVGVWVARYLGPSQFGIISYVQSFVGLFSVIASLGLGGIVVRELVKDEDRSSELVGTSFVLKIIASFIVLGFIIIATQFTSNDQHTKKLIYIVAFSTLFQSLNVVEFYFQSKVISHYTVYASLISLFLSVIAKILLLVNKATIEAFVWVIFWDTFIFSSGCAYLYIRHRLNFPLSKCRIGKKYFKFSFSAAKSLLKDSWPLILSSIVVAIYMKIDQVMIKVILDPAAVGQYAAAVRISESWYFIPLVITSSFFPAIVNAKKLSEELYYSRLQRLMNFMVWGAITIAIIVSFSSDFIINLLYGDQFYKASHVLMLHIWSGISVFFGVTFSKWMINENLQKYNLYIDGFGALLNICLNFIFIPVYGVVGAALATLLSYFGSMFFVFLIVKKLRIGLVIFFKSLLSPFYFIFELIVKY